MPPQNLQNYVKQLPYSQRPVSIQSIESRQGTINHSYRDFSKVPPPPDYTFPTKIDDMTFAEKVFDMLAQPIYDHSISWMPHGRSFRVNVPKSFESEVCPKYFGHSRYSSFLRDLNKHGFKHISKGEDRNCYYHELMLKGCYHLPQYMPKCRDARRLDADPANEPDFYSITLLFPLTVEAPAGVALPVPQPQQAAMKTKHQSVTAAWQEQYQKSLSPQGPAIANATTAKPATIVPPMTASAPMSPPLAPQVTSSGTSPLLANLLGLSQQQQQQQQCRQQGNMSQGGGPQALPTPFATSTAQNPHEILALLAQLPQQQQQQPAAQQLQQATQQSQLSIPPGLQALLLGANQQQTSFFPWPWHPQTTALPATPQPQPNISPSLQAFLTAINQKQPSSLSPELVLLQFLQQQMTHTPQLAPPPPQQQQQQQQAAIPSVLHSLLLGNNLPQTLSLPSSSSSSSNNNDNNNNNTSPDATSWVTKLVATSVISQQQPTPRQDTAVRGEGTPRGSTSSSSSSTNDLALVVASLVPKTDDNNNNDSLSRPPNQDQKTIATVLAQLLLLQQQQQQQPK